MPIPFEEAQKLSPSALIELFILDTTMLRDPIGSLEFFHAGTNELQSPVVWNATMYEPWGIMAEGFEMSGKGALPTPTLRVSNMGGVFSEYVRLWQDLRGARVTRIKTHARYLDAVNFANGNPEADPTMEYPREVWYIKRKSKQTNVLLEFQLGASWDVQGQKLPRGTVQRNMCRWVIIGGYRGPYCGYAGPPVAKLDDTPTSSYELDDCAGLIHSCELRFGENNPLPWGGYPGVALTRSGG